MDNREFIEQLGGPTELANLLGYGKYGTQRVSNWIARGIPATVLVKNAWLLKEYNKFKKAKSAA